MKLRKKDGKIVHLPLDPLFSMQELFGSLQQKYDAVAGTYIADRTKTPMVLRPQFSVSDKEGKISGDHTAELVNVVWAISAKVGKSAPVKGTHYTIDEKTHALTLKFNLDPDTAGTVSFDADFIDPRRKDVIKAHWKGSLSCVSATEWRTTLQTLWPMRTDLVPWKDRGTFQIPVQLMNGATKVKDDASVYRWQVFEDSEWRDVDVEKDFWCRGGAATKALTVEQRFIQRIQIRCLAYPKDNTAELQAAAFLLRRFYGYYDDDLDILEGQYIFPETSRAVAEAYVVNRQGGRIPAPEQYFDMEILYSRGDGTWWHVAHGSRGEVPRSMFPVDATMKHQFGWLTREISALLPFTINGEVLTLNGEILVGHHPVIDNDFEE